MDNNKLKELIFSQQQLAVQGIYNNNTDNILAMACFDIHSQHDGATWHAGTITHTWRNQYGILCVRYTSTLHWQYTWDESNNCLTWR